MNYNLSVLFFFPINTYILSGFSMCIIIFCAYYILIKKYGFPSFLVKFSSILITLLTCLAVFSPAFSFILTMIISSSLFFFTWPYEIYEGFWETQQNYLHQVLIFFSKMNFLDLLASIYIYFFLCSQKKYNNTILLYINYNYCLFPNITLLFLPSFYIIRS